jgi:hypothetical protein
MKTAIGLLEVFIIAIVLAFLATALTGTFEMQLLASVLITPIVIFSLAFVHYNKKRKVWSYAGASILGAFGVVLRVIISTQPNLEVGGGLPVGVTALYIVLGSLVALKNYECVLELRNAEAESFRP